MEAVFLKVLNMSITGGYVILALLLVRLLLKKAPKKYSYALWSVALFRLICPFSFSAAFSLFKTKLFDMSAAKNGATLTYVPENFTSTASPQVTSGIPAVNTVIAGSQADGISPLQIWLWVGVLLWVLGIAALILYNLITYTRLMSRLMTAVRLEGNIFESDNIRSPFILGFLRPKIYIPFGLSEQERAYILRHERIHLKRKDHFIKLLGLAILVLHWFNPLVWLAFSLMQKDMEMSCDEKVLSESDGITRDYGMSLLSFAANRRFLSASPLAFSENGVKERIKNILRYKQAPRWLAVLAVLLTVSVITACAVNPTPPKEDVEAIQEQKELYGNYTYEKQIYVNPLSSFIAPDGYKVYYTFQEDNDYITTAEGNQSYLCSINQKTALDEETFKNAFNPDDVGVPDISGYKDRFLLTDASTGYTLYKMDNELWLAYSRPIGDSEENCIWFIYKIKPYGGELPSKDAFQDTDTELTTFNVEPPDGPSDGVEEFLSLLKGDMAEYAAMTWYNITPRHLFDHSDYRLFRFAESYSTYLQYNGEVFLLASELEHIINYAAADIDKDGKPELYFTHDLTMTDSYRTRVSYFDPVAMRIVDFPYTCIRDSLTLADNGKEGLFLYMTSAPSRKAGYLCDIVSYNGVITFSPYPVI